MVSVGLISGFLGFGLVAYLLIDEDFNRGYTRGQVHLLHEMEREFPLEVNSETYDKNKYEYLTAVKDNTLYIYQGEEVKTLATWNYETPRK